MIKQAVHIALTVTVLVLTLVLLLGCSELTPEKVGVVATVTRVTEQEGVRPSATPLPKDDAPSPTPTPEPKADTPVPTDTPISETPAVYQLGDIISIGDSILVVLGWEVVPGDGYHEPDEGKQFIAVDVLLLNQGEDAAHISSDMQMVVKDSTGQRYEPDFDAQQAIYNEDPDGELAAGERVRGKVGFHVPEQVVSDLSFVFDAEVFGRGKVFVELGPEPASVEPPERLPGEQPPEAFSIGDVVEIGDSMLVVLGWEVVPGDGYHEPDEGKQFIAVDVLLLNQGEDAAHISSDMQMVVKDSTGQRYEPDFDAQQAIYNEDPDGELAAGERVRGKVGFQVPEQVMSDLSFVFDAEVFGRGKVFVELGPEPVSVEPPERLPGEQPPEAFSIGDVVEIGDSVLVVLGWEVVSGDGYHEPDEGKQFIAVDVLLLNQGEDAAHISSDMQMVVKDSTGQRYEPEFDAQQAVDSEDPDGELGAGERVRGKVGFQVPEQVVGDLTFVFDAEVFGRGKVFVELGPEPVSVEPPEQLPGE